jgi:hypothetical protein
MKSSRKGRMEYYEFFAGGGMARQALRGIKQMFAKGVVPAVHA